MDAASQIRRLLCLSSADDLQLESESFSADGFLSYRQRGSIRRVSETRPTRLFVKASDTSRSELNEAQEFSHKACRNECLFYAVMCPILARSCSRCRLRLPIPRVFGERVTDTTSLLVMEDLTEQGFSRTDKKLLTLEEAECVVKAMAELQAAYWLSRTDLNYQADAAVFGRDSAFFNEVSGIGLDVMRLALQSLPQFLKDARAFFRSDAEFLEVSRALPRILRFAASDSFKEAAPLGVAHCDAWASNFLFRRSGNGGLECRVIDWQFWCVGHFGRDLGQLLLTCLATDTMASEMDRLHFAHFERVFRDCGGGCAPVSEGDVGDCLVRGLVCAVSSTVVGFSAGASDEALDCAAVMGNIYLAVRDKMQWALRDASDDA